MSIGRWLRSFASRGKEEEEEEEKEKEKEKEEEERKKGRHSALTRNEAELRERRGKKKERGREFGCKRWITPGFVGAKTKTRTEEKRLTIYRR